MLVAGIASLAAGTAFLAFAALTIAITRSAGRLAVPSVMLLIGLMVILGVGFLDVAFAVFRGKGRRRSHLLSNATLYLSGGFLAALPMLVLGLGIVMGSRVDLPSILEALSISGIGLVAIRLARIRGRRASNQPSGPASPPVTPPAGAGSEPSAAADH